MDLSGRTLGVKEVADLLGIAPELFSNRRGTLYKRGFPRPLAGLRDRWSALRVLAWIDRPAPSEIQDLSVATSHDDAERESDRRYLQERYGNG